VPFQLDGDEAKSNNPTTWSQFEWIFNVYERGGYDGIGFMFYPDDGLCGVDLDGCRDPETGDVAKWAQEIITRLNTYAEVSPSGTGVKLFLRAKWPFDSGKNRKLPDKPTIGGKAAGIEVYDRGRYFAVTGQRLGVPTEPQERQAELEWIKATFWPEHNQVSPDWSTETAVAERARKYLAKVPPAVSGQCGHNATFHAACVLVKGFGLSVDSAYSLLAEWNAECQPPWSESELRHKLSDAAKARGPVNYLRDVHPEQWASVKVPVYHEASYSQDGAIAFRPITCAELDTTEYKIDYLIDHTLVAGQPCIIAGGKKSLKTSLIIDMGISLATGGFFLGKLKVTRALNVGVMTGESGMATVQETARRIAKEAGVSLRNIDRLVFTDQLPTFGDPAHMEALRRFIKGSQLEVVCIDPAYLCMSGDDAGNLFAQGSLLRAVNQVCNETGCTMVLAHHTRKGGKVDAFEPPELEDIAWAGFQEWARQWLLLCRRERYEPGTGRHRLWLSVGGSAGHSGLWALDVVEGVYDGHTPRVWEVCVMQADEARQNVEDRKRQSRERADQERLDADKQKIVNALAGFPQGETAKVIREHAGLNSRRFGLALAALQADGKAVAVQITKGNRQKPYDAYRLEG
jgi:hypothetical protein